jgi:hypothetical protein
LEVALESLVFAGCRSVELCQISLLLKDIVPFIYRHSSAVFGTFVLAVMAVMVVVMMSIVMMKGMAKVVVMMIIVMVEKMVVMVS